MQKTQGFTILELLITIVILSILVALAAPNFTQMIERNQVSTTSNDMLASILLARSTAVTREENMALTKDTSWENGWTVLDTGDNVILSHQTTHPDLSITAEGSNTSDSITYTPQGRTSPALVTGSDYFKISLGDSDRCINFSTSGRPSTGDCP